MTAHELIDSIFSRPQGWMPGNARHITPDQLKYLRDLISADPESGALVKDGPGIEVWKPHGRWKYVLTEDQFGEKHMLMKLANLCASDTGCLF